MAERSFVDRVDDAILVQCFHLSKLRQQSIHASLADFRQTSIENRDLCEDENGHRYEDYDIWAMRIERCNMMLANPDPFIIRRRVQEALEHDR
jgi:hypothetical protein